MPARTRLWLLFGVLGLTTAAAPVGADWLIARYALPAPLAWTGVAVVLIGVEALIWLVLDWSWIQPGTALAREISLLLHANAERAITPPEGHGLGELVDAILALAERWRRSHGEQTAALENAMARVRDQQSRLEAVLRNLSDGLIACSADRRILLFNDAALRILGGNPELGLDRPLDRLIAREPIVHAFELLRERQGGADSRPLAPEREEFVCATADGARLLRCRLALILDPAGVATGFVLDFADATERLARIEERGARLAQMSEELRGPVAALRAAAEVLGERHQLEPAERAAFVDVLERESAALSKRLEELCAAAEGLAAGDWPRADLYSGDLVRWVNRRLAGDPAGLRLTAVGPGLWLHGDGYHLTLLLERLARRTADATDVDALDLEAHGRDRRVELDLVWPGEPLTLGTIEAWLDRPLSPDQSSWRLREVLRHHQSELWSQRHERAGFALLRLPLPAPRRQQLGLRRSGAAPLPPRPEFYDFDLLTRRRDLAVPQLARPLGELSYVVFDTETTGLDPAHDDRIIQIAGVRIVNRRLLSGDVFEALVDPGQPIPKSSIRFHGITDAMVQGRPPLEIVLPQFRAFVGDAVLVAHNAAFDMAFVRRDEERCGVRFDNPVLDTLLLSAVLHDHVIEHSLDAIAARFGVTLVDRHQALGDAIGTAQVFLRLLELLAAEGVRTLGDALTLGERAGALRRRQAEQFGAGRAGRTTPVQPAAGD